MSNTTHIERMQNELADLNDRRGKLSDFILNNEIFKRLPTVDRDLMHAQNAAMKTYADILTARLARGLSS